jgi:diguanylate cyclase (GGDEF)-like protein
VHRLLTPFAPPLRQWIIIVAVALLLVLGIATSSIAQSAASATAIDPSRLQLDDSQPMAEAWPKVLLLGDESLQMTVEQVLAVRQRFEPPKTPNPTLGLRRDAVWMLVPLAVDAKSDGDWVMELDYPPLNKLDVYLTQNGKVLQRHELGSLRPFENRPLQSRSHALPLELQAGGQYELLLRAESRGAFIVPIVLEKPGTFHGSALNEQILQGLLLGLAIVLIAYSLGNFISLREWAFVKYAMVVTGTASFGLLQLGVGAQYVWTNNQWLELHMPGLSSLLAIAGTFLFLEESLREPGYDNLPRNVRFRRIMQGGAWLTLGIAVIYVLDLINTRVITGVVTVMGPLPSLIATPRMIKRTLRGDAIGICLLLGWSIYMVTVVIITSVIRGQTPVNFWTLHSLQFGSALDMLAFLYVLSLRVKEVRNAAQRVSVERDVMKSLALTDALTGLTNRRGLTEIMTAAAAGSSRERMAAVYALDLDGFKPVNDRFGHDVGDELLVGVSHRLRHSVRQGDTVARLGGDEFVIVASGFATAEQAQELAESLLRVFDMPFQLSEHQTEVGLTIGFALMPLDAEDAVRALKLADEALYEGKQAGKRCVRRAKPRMPATTAVAAA